VNGAILHLVLCPNFHPQRIHIHDWIELIQRPMLPGLPSSTIASVTLDISAGETSTPWISSKCPWISRVLMPRAYIDTILSSKPVKRVCPVQRRYSDEEVPIVSRGYPQTIAFAPS
jgi:hypothetical protein